MRYLLGCIRRADQQFKLIEPGDKVCVGLSGGKDSLALTYALSLYRKFCAVPFELEAVTLGMGYEGFDYPSLQRFCQSIGVPFTYKETDIKEVVFDIRQEANPCALCAKLRRGALNGLAKERGCTKVALGHHREDALETFLLSLFYEARLNVFAPVTYLERADITVIRPMIFVPEKHIINLADRLSLPVCHNPCPANGHTKRQDMKELLKAFDGMVPDHDAANRMLSALANTDQYRLWDENSISRRDKVRDADSRTKE